MNEADTISPLTDSELLEAADVEMQKAESLEISPEISSAPPQNVSETINESGWNMLRKIFVCLQCPRFIRVAFHI